MKGYDWDVWFSKTKKYKIYKDQEKEVVQDIEGLGRTFLDVACGEGRLLQALTEKKKEVEGLDINYNGFDILKDSWPKKKYDVVYISLSLICFDEEDVNKIITNMAEHTNRFLYFYEELLPDKQCGEKIGEQKWAHDITKHLTKFKPILNLNSPLNKVWQRYWYQV